MKWHEHTKSEILSVYHLSVARFIREWCLWDILYFVDCHCVDLRQQAAPNHSRATAVHHRKARTCCTIVGWRMRLNSEIVSMSRLEYKWIIETAGSVPRWMIMTTARWYEYEQVKKWASIIYRRDSVRSLSFPYRLFIYESLMLIRSRSREKRFPDLALCPSSCNWYSKCKEEKEAVKKVHDINTGVSHAIQWRHCRPVESYRLASRHYKWATSIKCVARVLLITRRLSDFIPIDAE